MDVNQIIKWINEANEGRINKDVIPEAPVNSYVELCVNAFVFKEPDSPHIHIWLIPRKTRRNSRPKVITWTMPFLPLYNLYNTILDHTHTHTKTHRHTHTHTSG